MAYVFLIIGSLSSLESVFCVVLSIFATYGLVKAKKKGKEDGEVNSPLMYNPSVNTQAVCFLSH